MSDNPPSRVQGEQVYAIGAPCSSMVKIGRTTDISARLKAIQRMSPVGLRVLWIHPGDHELETALHRYFADRRLHGEWFDFGDEDPIECIREAVQTKACTQTGAPSTRVRLNDVGDSDTICGACGHKGWFHAGIAGTPCDAMWADRDWGCTCPGFTDSHALDEG